MAFVQTILRWFGRESRELRTARTMLAENYRDLAHLVKQLRLHADRAPYAFVADRLRQLASEKEKSLAVLGEAIERLGGRATSMDVSGPSGKNHWERIGRDLDEQKQLEAQMLRDAGILALDAPDQGELLSSLVAVERRHAQVLADLVAKADPQAELT